MAPHRRTTQAAGDLAAILTGLGFERLSRPRPSDDALRVGRDRIRVTGTFPAMRTRVSVTAIAPSRDRAEEAIGSAFAEAERVVALLNRHDGASAVAALNGGGTLRRPPRALTEVLGHARRIHRLTRGAFDVTVQPVVDALRAATGGTRGTPPRAAPDAVVREPEVREALALVDMASLRVSSGSVRLDRPGMGVTLDGIGKGYVVDRMARVLEACGVRDWLVDAGGDIRASGLNERGRPWRIGVHDPEKRGGTPAVIELGAGAVATSGGYEDPFDATGRIHHVVQAASGRSPTHVTSATVVAPSATVADALATAALVLPALEALGLVDEVPGCVCLLIDGRGRQLRSEGWLGRARASYRTHASS